MSRLPASSRVRSRSRSSVRCGRGSRRRPGRLRTGAARDDAVMGVDLAQRFAAGDRDLRLRRRRGNGDRADRCHGDELDRQVRTVGVADPSGRRIEAHEARLVVLATVVRTELGGEPHAAVGSDGDPGRVLERAGDGGGRAQRTARALLHDEVAVGGIDAGEATVGEGVRGERGRLARVRIARSVGRRRGGRGRAGGEADALVEARADHAGGRRVGGNGERHRRARIDRAAERCQLHGRAPGVGVERVDGAAAPERQQFARGRAIQGDDRVAGAQAADGHRCRDARKRPVREADDPAAVGHADEALGVVARLAGVSHTGSQQGHRQSGRRDRTMGSGPAEAPEVENGHGTPSIGTARPADGGNWIAGQDRRAAPRGPQAAIRRRCRSDWDRVEPGRSAMRAAAAGCGATGRTRVAGRLGGASRRARVGPRARGRSTVRASWGRGERVPRGVAR